RSSGCFGTWVWSRRTSCSMTSAADMLRRFIQPISVAALAAALMGCFNSSEAVVEIYGSTMGSTYSIKWVADADSLPASEVKLEVDEMLEEFEEPASPWRPHPLLSRFNAAPAGTCEQMPQSILDLVTLAEELHEQSGGSFDITLGPLMRLWGFHGEAGPRVPDAAAI